MRDSKGRFVKGHEYLFGSEKGWFKSGDEPWNKNKTSKTDSRIKIGKENKSWKGQAKHTEGYILIPNKKHPCCNNMGYVFEHKLVMEKHLGRYLTSKEVVHHIDFNVKNNKIENLRLFENQSEHSKYHNYLKKINSLESNGGWNCLYLIWK